LGFWVLGFWRFVRKVSNLKASKPQNFKTPKLQNLKTPKLQAAFFSGLLITNPVVSYSFSRYTIARRFQLPASSAPTQIVAGSWQLVAGS
jgi:hypothetical protein